MIRDFKYILKRIIIGVGIALTLSFLRSSFILNTYALTSVPITVSDTDASQVINSNTRSITFGGNWNVMGFFNGYIVGSFSIQKTNNNAVEPIVTPRYVLAMSSTARYTCEIGSTTANNSTYVSQTYTYKCPVSFGDVGLDGIVVGFNGQQLQNPSVFIVDFVNRLNFYNEEPNINFDTSGTTNAINNQINNDNSNTQSIINNENQNTQSIINNQNSNTDKEIESQKVCNTIIIDKSKVLYENYLLNNTGNLQASNGYGVTDFIDISHTISITNISSISTSYSVHFCTYDSNKSFVNCYSKNQYNNSTISITSSEVYARFTINLNSNLPQFSFDTCKNGNQAISDSVNDLNNTLNNDDIDESSSTINNFFSNFNSGDTGNLTDIISLPLDFLQSLDSSCSPLVLPLPYLNTNLTIPCISSYLSSFVPSSLLDLIRLLVNGFLCYRILSSLVIFINQLKDPNNNDLEVMDL